MAEPLSVITILTLFGSTIVIGYIGYLISLKSKIPDVIWLMLFGLLIGPVFSLIDVSPFLNAIPFLSSLALLIILFDAGLHLNIYRVIRDTPRSLVLAVSGILLSMVLVGLISVVIFNIDIMTGLVLGAILGGTSSPIVLSLLRGTETEGKIKNLLTLESALTDALTIIVTLVLINFIVPISPYPPLTALIGPFSIGAMVGLVAGLAWLFILDRVKGIPFSHMLTLSIVFLLFAFVELAGGSGPLASLFFGVVIGNGKNFSIMLKFKKLFEVDPKMNMFQDEITFFIRSFFFVLMGLMVVINVQMLFAGLLISAALIAGRVITANIGMIKLHLPKIEKHVVRAMTPRGLAAAVLALIIQNGLLPNASFFADVVFIVILVTVTYSSVLIMVINRNIESENTNSVFKKIKPKRKKKSAKK